MSRIVMFVYNDVRFDARVWREAHALRDDGHAVTLVTRAAVGAEGQAMVDGISVWRIASSASLRARMRILLRSPRSAAAELRTGLRRAGREGPGEVVASGVVLLATIAAIPYLGWRWLLHRLGRPAATRMGPVSWLFRWYDISRIWTRGALAVIGSADAWHGHDLTGLVPAVAAQRRFGGRLIYDNHELYLDSSSNALQPRWARAIAARVERRWYRAADGVVAVNRAIASELQKRYGWRRIAAVHNVSERWDPPAVRPRRFHEVLGLEADVRIALYHGYLGANRGLEELAAALLEPGMERVHAVFLGMGSYELRVRDWSGDPVYGGRLHLLPAVPRDELLPWVASADVAVMAIQPSTTNHRNSSPNKLFEAMAAGVPMVASDFPQMRQIVDEPAGPLGLLVDPTDPAAVARAIVRLIFDPDLAAACRERCLTAARERWNWGIESKVLTSLYRRLLAGDPTDAGHPFDPTDPAPPTT